MPAVSDRFSQPRREQYITAARSRTDSTFSMMKRVKQRKGENAGAVSEPGSPSALAEPIRKGPVGAVKRAKVRAW